MYTDCEGLILRQTRILNGRRMIVLFTKKYGKISAGTSISERGKNKSSLALRPFTFGKYELYKNRDSFNINGAETVKSYYSLGEDVDKYMTASYALELIDNIVPEDQPAAAMFDLTENFLSNLETRKGAYDTLLAAFLLKVLALSGSAPDIKACMNCGKTDGKMYFSVADGGLICGECISSQNKLNPLIFELPDGIINAIRYMEAYPLQKLEGLALEDEHEKLLLRILKRYLAFHFGIENLKSEGLKI